MYQVYDIIILEEDTLQIKVIILTVTKKRSVTMNRGQVLAVDFENKKLLKSTQQKYQNPLTKPS